MCLENKTDKKSIGIIGGGFVGQILKKYYPEASVYDNNIKIKSDSLSDVINKKVIFIAVNFKDNCISQESKDQLHLYFDKITRKDAIIIIKSTFIPSTTDYFQNNYPSLKFVYNPEFLTELTAEDDFFYPKFQILGCTHQSLDQIHYLFELLPDAPIQRVISPLDAEVLKHAINSFYSLKVIFFNELFDGCNKLNADYETVREIMVQDSWIGDSHSKVFHKGYRGFGGKCLPKDSTAFKEVIGSSLLDRMLEINKKLNDRN